MKTAARNYTTYGNIGVVQISAKPEASLPFKPGAPELISGGLVITESSESGVVGKLRALNKTSSYLLLTDADVLTGAKQNRILNRSMLLAPMSETVIEVSCIERLRWHYTEKNFSNPGSVADPDLRKEKASSVVSGLSQNEPGSAETQHRVWSHVNMKLRDKKLENATESYTDYLASSIISAPEYPVCDPEGDCNGIAVLTGNKVVCIDIFGNNDTYRYYFNYLRDSAFRMASQGKKEKPADMHEAFYRSLEALDNFMEARKISVPDYNGAGALGAVESDVMFGMDLSMDGQTIHDVIFMK